MAKLGLPTLNSFLRYWSKHNHKILYTVPTNQLLVIRTDRINDSFDKIAKHAIVFSNKKTIGCARLRFVGKKAKLERIAVLKKYRNKGIGKLIMDYLIGYCKNKKTGEIIVHSQYYAKEFYTKFGFKRRGKIFMDAGIKHVEMIKKI